MRKKYLLIVGVVAVSLVSVMGVIGGFLLWRHLNKIADPSGGKQKPVITGEFVISKFANEEDVRNFLSEAEDSYGYMGFGGMAATLREDVDMVFQESSESGVGAPAMGSADKSSDVADRFSETNVQVSGIDEPDVVKTDGSNIYFSSENYGYYYDDIVFQEESVDEREVAPIGEWREPESETRILQAFPPENLKQVSSITRNGNLLLYKDILIVLDYERITAYDVSNSSDPKEKWSYSFDDRSNMIEARMYEDNIYIIVANYMDSYSPCPVKVLSTPNKEISLHCDEIYYSNQSMAGSDTLYSVLKLDSKTGNVLDKTSFLGGGYDWFTTVYMSANYIYIGTYYIEDMAQFFADFVMENKDLFPEDVRNRIASVMAMDIGQAAKMTELGEILERFTRSFNSDDMYQFENEIENRFQDFSIRRKRDFDKTGIVKISIDNLEPDITGAVPGRLLNQFSMDEYEGNLRVATTVGGGFMSMSSSNESENDVYILDKKMKTVGYVQGMGLDERIYSVRFLGKMGYVVTFREIDPFYVLDLSDPKNPVIEGELKIPGYSSYLHPLKDNMILGIGDENGNVKLSLFDVSDPKNPVEQDKYMLTDYWSEVQSNHRAFLQDSKHEIFFIPASQGGNIFSYKDNKLTLEKSIADWGVKRAVFLDDYLYIIGENGVVVLDETNWETVKKLEF